MSRADNLRAYRERVAADMAARAEDIAWMAETGESLSGAARRLGLKPGSLEEWCKDNGFRDELDVLRSREPADPFTSERARLGAAARWSA